MPTIKSIKTNPRPLYDQAIDAVSELISSSLYHPGDRLPPETELASQLGISRSTLREAIGYLESRGVVYRKHGVGAFIAQPAQHIPQRGLDEVESLISLAEKVGATYERLSWNVSTVSCSNEIAEKLSVQVDDKIIRVESVVTLDNAPYAYLDGYVLPDLVDLKALEMYPRGSLLDYLFQKNAVRVSHTYTKIMAVVAEEPLAQRAKVSPGSPLLQLDETYQSQDGVPLVFTHNYFNTQTLNFYIIRRIVQS